MKDKEPPYKIRFDDVILKAVSLSEEDKTHFCSAGLEKLKGFLPKDINFDKNYDVLGVALNAAVAGMGNRNKHIISSKNGLEIAKTAVGKFINIEHNRQKVIGYITNYGFSTYPWDEPLTYEQAEALANEGKVFNMTLGGVLWRAVNPEFCEFVESSADPSSKNYLKVSASWEVGFTKFNIARGSKYYSECEIISDAEEIAKLKNRLTVFKGPGVDEDGNDIYVDIQSDGGLFMGIGLVENPAAYVSGLITNETPCEEEHESPDDKDEIEDVESSANVENPIENVEEQSVSENISENPNNLNVINITESNIKNMPKKIKSIEDIKGLTREDFQTVEAADLSTVIENRLAEISSEWSAKVVEKETKIKEVSDLLANLQNEIETLKNDKSGLEASLNDLKNSIAQKDAEDAFQSRMNFLDDTYELSDEDRALIVEEVKACGDEASFESLSKKYEVLLKEKNKAVIAARKEEEEKNKKSVVTTPAEVIAGAAVENPPVPSAVETTTDTIKDRMLKAFAGENVKITINK